ncbi:SGNH/GDSL hydrolase family protein [Aeromicrobium alkaliterrae]|uniref:SGNH hydrolase-type esterase domain-containing protein n=1 Tax=Aeromicrobium alkaliterrae TaxID=302168 RepID=A0ABN2JZQ5_9ACTN
MTADPPAQRPQAIAVGDSVTLLAGAVVDPAVAELTWAERVAADAGWDLRTFAVSGARTAEIVELVPTEGRFDVALACAGTNDCISPKTWDPARFRSHVEDLAGRLAVRADQVVLLGLAPNLLRLPVPLAYGFGRARRVRTANAIIAAVADLRGAVFVPAPRLRTPVELYGDRIHPTTVGSARLAGVVAERLGVPHAPVTARPSAEFLRASRRKLLHDAIVRPPRGVMSSLLGLVARRRARVSRSRG